MLSGHLCLLYVVWCSISTGSFLTVWQRQEQICVLKFTAIYIFTCSDITTGTNEGSTLVFSSVHVTSLQSALCTVYSIVDFSISCSIIWHQAYAKILKQSSFVSHWTDYNDNSIFAPCWDRAPGQNEAHWCRRDPGTPAAPGPFLPHSARSTASTCRALSASFPGPQPPAPSPRP